MSVERVCDDLLDRQRRGHPRLRLPAQRERPRAAAARPVERQAELLRGEEQHADSRSAADVVRQSIELYVIHEYVLVRF